LLLQKFARRIAHQIKFSHSISSCSGCWFDIIVWLTVINRNRPTHLNVSGVDPLGQSVMIYRNNTTFTYKRLQEVNSNLTKHHQFLLFQLNSWLVGWQKNRTRMSMHQPGVDKSAMMIYQYYCTTSLHDGMQNFEGKAQQINSHTSVFLVDVSYLMMMIWDNVYWTAFTSRSLQEVTTNSHIIEAAVVVVSCCYLVNRIRAIKFLGRAHLFFN
jgi:hypothetical protein